MYDNLESVLKILVIHFPVLSLSFHNLESGQWEIWFDTTDKANALRDGREIW